MTKRLLGYTKAAFAEARRR